MRGRHIAAITTYRSAVTRAEILIVVALWAVLVAMMAPMLRPASKPAREASNLVICKESLRRLGVGLLAYAQDNRGVLPVSETVENPHTAFVHAVLSERYVSDSRLFYCPSLEQPNFSPENIVAGNISYFYYSAARASGDQALSKFLLTGVAWPRELNTHLDSQSWVMSDIWKSGEPTAHAGYKKGVNYLMLDGSVGFVAESPRQAFH